MTYREAIEKSLYTIEIEDCAVSEEQKLEILHKQMLPLPL